MSVPNINKALRFNTLGGDLELKESELLPLKANEVLVKVHAASINPVDIQLWRSGLVAVVSGDKGMGRDYSGSVVAVGQDVKEWSVGDDIFGLIEGAFGQNTFSQYVTFNPSSTPCAKKPSCFSHEMAAAIPLVALTAFSCLDWLPQPSTSQRKVVVRGASGGVGSWVIQLAKLSFDCHVTAICSSRNADYVRKLGADEVIDYTSEKPVESLLSTAKATQPYDLIIDCVGGMELLNSYLELLHPKGAYVTIVGDKTSVKTLGGPITYFTNPRQVLRFIRGYIWGPRYACVYLYPKSELLEKVVRLGERGELHIEVQEVIQDAFDPETQGWKRAVELIESARIRGKVVLAVP